MRDSLGIYYDYIIRNKDGKTVKKIRRRKCRSFVRQFLDILSWEMSNVSTSITDTGNTARTLDYTDTKIGLYYFLRTWYLNAAITTSTYGNVVGSGTNAVAITDYKLQTQIAHGTGAGQLQYSAETFGAPSTDAAGTTFIATRIFTNGSGNNVTVAEIGLYVLLTDADTARYFCIARDLLSPAVTLANGEAITINYTFTTAI